MIKNYKVEELKLLLFCNFNIKMYSLIQNNIIKYSNTTYLNMKNVQNKLHLHWLKVLIEGIKIKYHITHKTAHKILSTKLTF